ncbi:MAG TPA: glycosyltransferase family 87 protein [Candidatus Saccharimonadales bacterium]|nr:glycosyltransferase family 87 protein [Candidatus Saccharimonadales bacterium]
MSNKDAIEKVSVITGLVILYCLLLFVIINWVANPRNNDLIINSDFSAFISGAAILKDRPTDLYNKLTQTQYQANITHSNPNEGYLAFRNPPIVALMYVPFTFIPYKIAYGISMFVNALLLLLAVYLLSDRKLTINSVFLLAILFMFVPVVALIDNGQISFLLLLIFIGIIKSIKDKKDFTAGLLTGILFIKIQYLLAFPLIFLISKSKKSYTLGFIISCIANIAINMLLYKSSFISDYLKFLFFSENINLGTESKENVSIVSLFAKAGINNTNPHYLLYILGTILILFGIFAFKIVKAEKSLQIQKAISAIILFITSVNIHVMAADLVLQIIPIMFLIKSLDGATKDRKLRIYFLLAILLLTPILGFFKLQWVGSIIYVLIAFYFINF